MNGETPEQFRERMRSIGFLGGGTILKLTDQGEVHGLTTAAGIWMTAAASATAALGQIAVAIIGTVFGLVVLILFRSLERKLGHRARAANPTPDR